MRWVGPARPRVSPAMSNPVPAPPLSPAHPVTRHPPAAGTAREARGRMDALPLAPPDRSAGGPAPTFGRVFAVYPTHGWAAVATWHDGFVLAQVPAGADLRAGDELLLGGRPAPGPAAVVLRRTGERLTVLVLARGLSAERLPRLVPARVS